MQDSKLNIHYMLLDYCRRQYNVMDWEELKYYEYDFSKNVSVAPKTLKKSDIKELKNTMEKKTIWSKKNDEGYTLTISKKNNKYKTYILPDKEKLDKYVKHNEKIAKKLIHNKKKDIPVTITFKKPYSLEELDNFINSNDLEISSYVGRAFGEDNEKVTFSGVVNNLSDIDLENIVKVSAVEDTNKIAGFFTINATVKNAHAMENILDNRDVFLVDVLRNEIEENVKDKIKEKEKNEEPDIDFEVHNPYWYIEEQR